MVTTLLKVLGLQLEPVQTHKRYLIVNADDFGLSAGVNRGIAQAYELGIVTSASLMVRWPAASEAAAYAQKQPGLSVGLHVDMGEWICRNGSWEALYEVVSLDDEAAVAEQIAWQLDTFHKLMARAPTHLDSHQHVHLDEPVRSLLLKAARDLGVPLRRCTPGIRYCGDFYGQTGEGVPIPGAISVETLAMILTSLRPGATELCCHPGDGIGLNTMYSNERAEEVEVLCDQGIQNIIERMRIDLVSFGDLKRHIPLAEC